MKKKIQKLSSLALALILVLSLSVTGFAADISAEKAKEIALKDAGLSAAQVSGLSVRTDYDDGVKYFDVSFYVQNANGSYTEYDYDIKASDGRILDKEADLERSVPYKPSQTPSGGTEISAEQAKQIALKHFNVNGEDVKFTETKKDYDDGKAVYEIEFCEPYSVKYTCEVVASSGVVREAEKENVRGIGDIIELFFKVIIWQILN